MDLAMNMFTGRELSVMRLCAAGRDDEVAQDAMVDPIKVMVAKTFPEKLWGARYFQAIVIQNALNELSEYNTAALNRDWVWYVPRTPSTITLPGGPTKFVRPIANPERYNEYLAALVNRPITELAATIDFIGNLEGNNFLYPKLSPIDDGVRYWKLSWRDKEFMNLNVIYIRESSEFDSVRYFLNRERNK